LKRVAFIFPGQGSQAVGMGKDFFEKSDEVKAIFKSAGEKSGIDFEKLLFEEGEDLQKTQFTQPAILLVSAVAHKLFSQKVEIEPTLLLGHSLGEVSALVASGAISIEDGVQLVNRRGNLMSGACSDIDAGMMAVIGLSNEKVEEICESARGEGKKVWSANYNGNGQVVLAGIKGDLDSISGTLKEAGAKRALLLNMSVSSHCQLLEPAVDDFRETLQGLDFGNISSPIVSNVTTEKYNTREEAIDLLSKQLTEPVRYQQSIESIADEVDLFIEFGHGGVLKGLNRRIVKAIPTLVVSDMDSLQKAVEEVSK
jgi:[acyl-carrier-protein] S-malonyltransferase